MGRSNFAAGVEWVGGDGECPGELDCSFETWKETRNPIFSKKSDF
jgi:hypothetical protein